MSFLGLDVGTTGCKAISFDLNGNILAQAYREYPLIHSQPGFSELDAERLWRDIAEVLKEVNSYLSSDPAEAMGVSCQGEAVTAIDNSGSTLCNFIVSFDHRTIPQENWWQENYGAKKLFDITGMPLHAMYSINKIMWWRDNFPEVYNRAVKFLCVEDFVNYKLTGQYATDFSLAARTMAFDVRAKCWSDKVLSMAGVDKALFPNLYQSGTPIGQIRPAIGAELGFKNKVTVATGGHDQTCGALGAGIVEPGVAMNATGTSDVVCPVFLEPVLSDDMLASNYCCYPHVVPDQYVSIAVNLTGGLLLRWYRDTFCDAESREAQQAGRNSYDVIIEQASDEIRSLYFLPHFVGAGTPYLDSHSLGALVGLTIDTTRQDISKALLDSVNYEMKINIDLMNKAGLGIESLRAIGGGAKSKRWLQMKADTFGMPVSSMKVSEAASLGAAMLGGISIGAFKDTKEAVESMVSVEAAFEPDSKKTQLYNAKYQQYKKLYPSLKRYNLLLSKDYF